MNAILAPQPLPALPASWSSENEGTFIAKAKISAPVHRNVEPVGPHFLAHARRKRHRRTFSEDDRIIAAQQAKNIEDVDSGEISEAEDKMMLNRDPKDWKNQDHYAVLGLSKYRWRATDDQIKKAHRKKVLRHHPDKKAAAGINDDDNFFKCIQKAMEILQDSVKRRQYDSIDPGANIEPPTRKVFPGKTLYKLWNPVFDSEARFSKTQPAPHFGTEASTKPEVEAFYNFWYNFDSWRTFEYLDEDVPDDNENRDQKRHVERKNKAQRAKKKTEDTARLRNMVDLVLSLDTRIKKFKEAERLQKDAKKIAREAEEKKSAEAAKIAAEVAAKKKAEDEAAAKASKVDTKKAKEAAKNAAKKNKRAIRKAVEDVNYFSGGGAASADTITTVMADVEVLIAKLDLEDLDATAKTIAGKKGVDDVKAAFAEKSKELVENGFAKDADFRVFLA